MPIIHTGKERGGFGNDSHTVLLLQSDYLNGSQYFVDQSHGGIQHIMTPGSTCVHSTAIAPQFGNSSIYIDHSLTNTGWLRTPTHNDFNFSGLPFTIDFLMYPVFNNLCVLIECMTGQVSPGWTIYRKAGGQLTFYSNFAERLNSSAGVTSTLNQWYHVHFDYNENQDITLYVGGRLDARVNDPGINAVNGADPLIIGARYNAGNPHILYWGYMDQIRVSKGIARWSRP